jgi:DNA-binding winged helix-turn-helix (wHTH) protein/tetratricopeptide (TPR) repeat protein/TolB-like protein
MSNEGKELYEFGPFRLDPRKRILLRDNQPVPLQLKAVETLLELVKHSEQVVLKEDLMNAVWPDAFVEESNLAQNIFMLRKTLREAGGGERYIVTIPGRGYRFSEKVRIVPESGVTAAIATTVRTEVRIEERRLSRRAAVALAGAVLVFLGLGTGVGVRRYRQWRESSAGAVLKKARPAVAVLGFQNLTGKDGPAWLSTAFAEMFTTELAAGNQLRVVPPETAEEMKKSLFLANGTTLPKETLARIHQTLGADLVVVGSYSDLGPEAGGQLRLDMRLLDTKGGATQATISEMGTETGLFSLVARAGARLREHLAVPPLSTEQAEGVLATLPSSTEAARFYALGLQSLRQYDALGARDWLEQAIRADPTYALAHSALAGAWSQLGYETKAVTEARKAFELSDKLDKKDRLFIEARFRLMNKEWERAEEIYRTLFDFFPDDIEYGLLLADAQTQGGKAKDALATVQAMRQLPAPSKDDVRIDLAEELCYIRMGQYSQARGIAAKTVDKASATGFDVLLARALYLKAAVLSTLGESEQALAAADEAKNIYQRAGDPWGVCNTLENVAFIHTQRGEWEAAEKLDQQALELDRKLGNQAGAAMDLTAIAADRESRGDLEGGRKMDEEALAIYREVGDKGREGWALMGVCWAAASQGDLRAGLRMDDEALVLFQQVADQHGTAYALEERASELTMLGRLEEAKQAAQRALEIGRQTGAQGGVLNSLFYLGNIAKLEGDFPKAEQTFAEALKTARQENLLATVALIEQGLAEIALEQNRLPEAREHVTSAQSFLREHKEPGNQVGAASVLARIDLAQGDTQGALGSLQTAKANLLEAPQDREAHFVFGIAQARVQAARGELAQARESLQAVLAETGRTGFVRYQLEARLVWCEVESKVNPASARAHAKTLEADARTRGFGLFARKALALSA